MDNTQYIGTANTLKELRELLGKAIEEYGEDATWAGWDDGNIYVSRKDKRRKVNPLGVIDHE